MTRTFVLEASGNLWGSERALLDLLDGMAGAEVAVCCPPDTPLLTKLFARAVPVFPFYIRDLHRKSRWHRFKAAIGVLRACVQFRPDVIYLNQSGSYRVALFAAALLNLPIVAHVRIFEDAAYLAARHPSRRRLRGIVAISSAIEKEVRRYGALDPIPVHQIYDAYAPSSLRVLAAPAHASNRIACIGRLVPVKGQDILIGAINLLARQDVATEFLIAGEGEEAFVDRLKRDAAKDDGATSLQWLGFVPNSVALLESCGVLVCPSHREPLGRVIFEAWDAGALPVAFSGSGGAAEIIRASDGGILYETQTSEALAAALHRVLTLDRETAVRMVENGRSWMKAHCDPETYGRAMAAIFAGRDQA